ncbi:MAG: formylglycine-generating enzyme family protein [Candidatus Hydrogenedentes bacterium]|nr:formylglycine-generating enzyme family protein [Candidatus Hydrogenedentota bacterium]
MVKDAYLESDWQCDRKRNGIAVIVDMARQQNYNPMHKAIALFFLQRCNRGAIGRIPEVWGTDTMRDFFDLRYWMLMVCVLVIAAAIIGCQPSYQSNNDDYDDPPGATEETIMLPGNVPLEMVWIPAGTFLMGRWYPDEQDSVSDEAPQHQVTLSQGFWMGKYEVTQTQWEAVMGSNPAYFSGANRPVEWVSWNEVQSFITALNSLTGETFRLPTEAEWEYACRGGRKTRFYWGDDPTYTQIGNYAWYGSNSGGRTHDVGTKLPNGFDLYDMSGNVWEWCQDWYDAYSSGSVTDPTGPASGPHRVGRGGGWSSDGAYCRSAYRSSFDPSGTGDYIGFRLSR